MSTIELVILCLDLVLKCANSLKTDSVYIKLKYLAFQFSPFINGLTILCHISPLILLLKS